MAADVLGRRIDDHRRTMVEGPHQGGGRRVVHDQRHAQLAPHRGDFRDGEDLQLGVGQGLGVVAARACIGRLAESLGIGGVDVADLDAHGLHRVRKKVPGSTVKVCGTYEIVTCMADVLDREQACRLARGQAQASDAALQGRDALFQHVHGRIHDPGVDVAELLEREEVRCVFGAVELVGGRLVDRHGHRIGRLVLAEACVQDQGFGMLAVGHGAVLRTLRV